MRSWRTGCRGFRTFLLLYFSLLYFTTLFLAKAQRTQRVAKKTSQRFVLGFIGGVIRLRSCQRTTR
jgi:hypothetical protein